MPAKKETPKVETAMEAPLYHGPFCGTHLAIKIVIGLVVLFIGFGSLVAAFGTGFAAGRMTGRAGDARYGMMGRGAYATQRGAYCGQDNYGSGMMGQRGRRDLYKNGPAQGTGQCPVYPGNQSYGGGSD